VTIVPSDPKDILKRFASLKTLRLPYEAHWENLAEFILPRKQGMTRKLTEGQKLTDSQYDQTPTQSAEKLASFIHSSLSSTEYPFFGLQTRNSGLMDIKSIADWLETCGDLLLSAFSQSNWDSEVPESYLDGIVFGTDAPMFLEERAISRPGQRFGGLHFTAIPLADSYCAENATGVIDTLYRPYKMSADSINSLWPGTASANVKQLAQNKPYEPVDILLAIYPRKNPERGPEAFAWQMPYAGCYLEIQTQTLLEEKGFREFPAPTARWSKGNSDRIYGRGRGDTAYPDVRTLNETIRYKLMSLALAIFPPLMKDSGLVGSLRWLPGAVHEVDGKKLGMDPPIQPIMNGARFDVAEIEEEKYREAIRESFYASLLQLPDKEMTAREALIRLRLMQRVLASSLGRKKSELLDPTISRAFNLMLHGGALPPPPDELLQRSGEDGAIDIVYKGPLAMSQRTDDALAIDSQVDYILSLFERTEDPAVLDPIDLDEASWERGAVSSVPSKVMRGKDQVAEIRAGRAQQQAALAAREERNMMAEEMLTKAQAGKAGQEAEASAAAAGAV